MSETMALSSCRIVLSRVDLPALVCPTIATGIPFLIAFPKEKELINWEVYSRLDNYSTDSGLRFDKETQDKIKAVMRDVGKAVNRVIGESYYWVAYRDFIGVKRS